jgi:nitrogen fixation-related uncharacterized protein
VSVIPSLGYTLVIVALTVAALWWAIKSGQFKQQERARRLPLNDDMPEGEGAQAAPGRKKGERPSVPPVLAAIVSAAVLLGLAYFLVTQ